MRRVYRVYRTRRIYPRRSSFEASLTSPLDSPTKFRSSLTAFTLKRSATTDPQWHPKPPPVLTRPGARRVPTRYEPGCTRSAEPALHVLCAAPRSYTAALPRCAYVNALLHTGNGYLRQVEPITVYGVVYFGGSTQPSGWVVVEVTMVCLCAPLFVAHGHAACWLLFRAERRLVLLRRHKTRAVGFGVCR